MSKLAARVCELVPDAFTLRADGDKWATLFGPPGTGKTTSMLRLVEAMLSAGAVDPDELMVATFTRNARAEAYDRLKGATGLDPAGFPWVRTIHSACYRLLELSSERVMSPRDYIRFGEAKGYKLNVRTERDIDDPFGASSIRTFDDWLLAVDELRRNKRLDIDEAVETFRPPMQLGLVTYSREIATQFARDLTEYKRETGLVDFTDMLEAVARQRLKPPVTHLFIDEAQDLTPLQWEVVHLWAEDARRVFVFGDDDQAIFEWAGAESRALMNLPGSQIVLSKSHRLPSEIHAEAMVLAGRMSERVDKRFDPLRTGGSVGRVWSWYEALTRHGRDGGRLMLLARNRAFLEDAREVLRLQGEPFLDRAAGSGIPDPKSNRGRAIKTAHDLGTGRLVMGRMELTNLQRNLRPGLWRGTPEKRPMYGLDDLPPRLAAELRRAPLAALRMPEQERTYLASAIERHGADVLTARPAIELSTIHGVKGEEAEHVVVCTAMTGQTYVEYRTNPDSEHRVFYVAATRAKQSLSWLHTKATAYDR